MNAEDGKHMPMNEKEDLLREAYLSMSEGISNIESYLPKVESEEMNYDLNRQLQDYHRMADRCKEELQRQGESLSGFLNNRQEQSQQSNISFKDSFKVSYMEASDTDTAIARTVVDDITNRMNTVRKFADNSSSDAVNSIAMEIIEEEENHMDWMKSYVN